MDLPYSHSSDLGKSKKGTPRASTTGDIAEILEDKYGIMEFFWNRYQKDIMSAMEEGLEEAFTSFLMGAPLEANAFAAGEAVTEDLFRKFLIHQGMDYEINVVPTAASIKGVNHRMKIKRGPPRPSFIDTGLYESSFKCWVDK